MIYRQKKDREKEKYYLALSSLSDIQSAITDHASLWMLAVYCLKMADIERAYHYIRFSWDETEPVSCPLKKLAECGYPFVDR